jgi:hypothetical protein
MARFIAIWKIVLWIVWAMWWGGLSFYAIVVVPIGTEQIGSVDQGFITQQVTYWHNVLCVVFSACLIAEAYRRKSRLHGIVAMLLAVLTAMLIAGHILLTKQMNFDEKSVPSDFYTRHAMYLWITAAEWFLGLTIPVLFQQGQEFEVPRHIRM